MSNLTPMTGLLLGTGGRQAGVLAVHPDTLDVRSLLDFPVGHSTYAVDVDVEQAAIAVGTRGGLIEILRASATAAGPAPHLCRRFVQGAPILSICQFGDGWVAATDVAGRCLAWDAGADTDHATAWNTGAGLTCGLTALGDSYIAAWRARECC